MLNQLSFQGLTAYFFVDSTDKKSKQNFHGYMKSKKNL